MPAIDENLPTFFLKNSPDNVKHNRSYFLSYRGSTPEPAYTLKSPDPASPNSRNRYACALFDAFNPDVLFGEVLIVPNFTQPSLSAEAIRKNGGIPPPPEPILSKEFTVQLYSPDLQIHVTQKPGSWGGSATYEFAMPQNTFRAPSASALDKSQSDPGAAATTPHLYFAWKRENKFSKDFTCYLTGRSTDVIGKKKNKEPDIAIALFRSLREVTIYEPNLYRVDMEDPKGLEVTILLAATVIKDIYFGNIKEAFNVSESNGRTNTFLSRKTSPTTTTNPTIPTPTMSGALAPPTRISPPTHRASRQSLPKLQTTPPPSTSSRPPPKQTQPPLTDARTQWEIDAETTRLRAEQDAEAQRARIASEARRRERERQDEAEARRLRKQFEAEDKERRRKEADIERETQRLRRVYGNQEDMLAPLPPPRQRPHSYSVPQGQQIRPVVSSQHLRPQQAPLQQQQRPPRGSGGGLYLQPVAAASSVSGLGGQAGYARPKPKKSFWGLRSVSDDGGRLMKKQSSIF
ncbi:MAG: hypothetical protein M1820_008112 [Bogoriella megaspora]|nr:MAG: hypothetical protein M1820_008112 [Bogoriella megaspora]